MELITKKHVLRQALEEARAGGSTVGLVPTMGALHAGHLSLIHSARQDCDIVVVSIFVNPTQFGDPADLESYPRTPKADRGACERAGVDIVFQPSAAEMYATKGTVVVPAGLVEHLEGRYRPGHLTGVATVVTKLFALTRPWRAYFGEKDFQQLVVVRQLVADLDLAVQVVGCPIVREPDGLALSSRNSRLDDRERAAAPSLFRALTIGAELVASGETAAGTISEAMSSVLGADPLVLPDYAVVAEPHSLRIVTDITSEVRLLVAASIGGVRLIDNLASRPPRRPDHPLGEEGR